FLICISLLSFVYFGQFNTTQSENEENLNLSGTWATLDLNPSIFNGTRIQTNSIISVQGRLWNRITSVGKDGYTVVMEVDGTLYSAFNDITSGGGYFQIDYNIGNFLNVFANHRLEVKVSNPVPPGDVEYRTHYNIDVSTNSYFETYDPTDPIILGEIFYFEGHLRYENGTGIAFQNFDYHWYQGSTLQSWGSGFTDNNGKIQYFIPVPDIGIDDLTLKLNYTLNPVISYSESYIYNTKLFSNVSCNWNLPTPISENRNFRIRGQLVSSSDPSILISNRYIRIFYNGTQITAVTTDVSGRFDYPHALGAGIGLVLLEIEVDNFLGKDISTQYFITVEAAPPPITPPPVSDPPFALFFSIFIPIIVGIVVGLSIYGYYHYKKQDRESRVVNLPLENRIKNLLILKDTGRLEESLSYLFNAIYLDLVQAKFGKTRNDNETIRDFAIISVKEFNLSPTNIYPFIQKVEEIIYAKPYRISDIDFFNTIELFSPIYHELTGYNFVLN
ncbi:MAG: hypothetical protein KGD73_05265, partial [Candidatus Lokiarchaeota archaeon]|nr:hypothetical protein [Candidatus Lokiarchaeota archaeon]